MLILGHDDVRAVLADRELDVVELVRDTYRRHDEGDTALPHSVFLRFPDSPRDRIIGLPAYVGGPQPVAGLKWISSFPGNIDRGVARASAAVVLNSLETGHPVAFIEGALISAQRTAASAALAADLLTGQARPAGVALIGCGVINFEVLRFLAALLPPFEQVVVYDHDPARAEDFAVRAAALCPKAAFTVAASATGALAAQPLISLATTAGEPHLDLSPCAPGSRVLHVSLRDLTVEAVLGAANVVDDADHVCRERTSLHLAEQATGGRDFIDASIGQLIRGRAHAPGPARTVVFSPFGLGVLDLALAAWVRTQALRQGVGTTVTGFITGNDSGQAAAAAPSHTNEGANP
ncbi:2,3-diaminopropionate biosynthesis protein SbnB [Catellatospora methionotrophica]|uniref:2,3-diaminopropionate biosynthesis protein SbnB n=1 Tax=Catellatospora methionotrophica TaxID=121620 RepID=A0A8J3LE02_9ACTN|nr:2,3-diaminopropionate biosynthesis protein SbnB [Catellatospora methionotrophica]GIG18972.1 2,3-diaminopropionate biosynthesis protein SbnB [Catellatospora methionotrophica]